MDLTQYVVKIDYRGMSFRCAHCAEDIRLGRPTLETWPGGWSLSDLLRAATLHHLTHARVLV